MSIVCAFEDAGSLGSWEGHTAHFWLLSYTFMLRFLCPAHPHSKPLFLIHRAWNCSNCMGMTVQTITPILQIIIPILQMKH